MQITQCQIQDARLVFQPPQQKYCRGEKIYTIKLPAKSMTFPTLYIRTGARGGKDKKLKNLIFLDPLGFLSNLGQNWPFLVIFAENRYQT